MSCVEYGLQTVTCSDCVGGRRVRFDVDLVRFCFEYITTVSFNKIFLYEEKKYAASNRNENFLCQPLYLQVFHYWIIEKN